MNVSPVSMSTITFKADEKASDNKTTVHPKTKLNVNPLSATGWITAGALAAAGISGLSNHYKLHLVSAVIAMFSGAAHIGIASAHQTKHPHKEINA